MIASCEHICDCDCHDLNNIMMHTIACCDQCILCGENITDILSHKIKCHGETMRSDSYRIVKDKKILGRANSAVEIEKLYQQIGDATATMQMFNGDGWETMLPID